jgi:WD40 repeat protein
LAVQFPKPLKPITSGNISQLRQVAYFGSPVLKGFQITSDNKLGFVITTAGISVYDLATNQLKNTYDAIICTERYKACGSLALSSDGSRFALFTKNMVQVWDLDEGMILEIPLYSATRAYDRVELSPDGKFVAIVTNEATSFGPWNVKIKIYAIDTGKELTGLPDFQGGNILFSPDGTWFAEWSENKNIGGTIWRIANWSNQHDIILPADQVVKGFSQDGQSIVLQGNEQINIYQIEEWRLKRQLIVHQDQFRQTKGLYFSPSGNMIAVRENFINSTTFISEDLVSVFNISTGEKISEQTLPAGIDAFSLTNDGGLSSYQIPDEVCKEIGIELTCKKWHQWWKANVQFTNDASLFRLWRWDGGPFNLGWNSGSISKGDSIQPGGDYTQSESSDPTFLNQDGQFFVLRKGTEDDKYEVRREFDGSGPAIGEIHSKAQTLQPYWLSPDEKYLLFSGLSYSGGMSYRTTIELWDIQKIASLGTWSSFRVEYATNQDGNLLALSLDDQLLIYDFKAGRIIYRENYQNITFSESRLAKYVPLAFTADGYLICATANTVSEQYIFEFNLLDPQTQKRTLLITGVAQYEYYIDAIALSPDGSMLAVGMANGTIRVFNLSSGLEIYNWQAHSGNVTELKFALDGTFLVSLSIGSQNGGDGHLRVWGIWP